MPAINDFELLPAHLERAAFADPAQYRFRTRYDTDPTNPGLYNGPYRITEIGAGLAYRARAATRLVGAAAGYFRRIVVWAIENTAALEANLLAGGLDMVAGELGLSLDEALAFEKRHGERVHACSTSPASPSSMSTSISTTRSSPIGACARRCSTASTARRSATQLFAGRQPVADSFVPPLDWVYTDDVPHYPYDPAKARALLDEAGWRGGPDGIRRNADGKPLSLDLTTTAGNRTRELVEQVLQSQWREIGVDDPASRTSRRACCSARPSRTAISTWRCSPGSARPRTCRARSCTPTRSRAPATVGAARIIAGFSNAEMDRLIDAIEIELDRDKPRRAVAPAPGALRRASCRRCRSISAPTLSSCRNGSRA